MENKITAKGLYKKYRTGKSFVLRDVNFEIKSGHVYGLVAPNGSGKTTLMKCIAGTAHFTGKIGYNGTEVGSHFNGQIVHSASESLFISPFMKVIHYLHAVVILKNLSFKETLKKFRGNPNLAYLEKYTCVELSTGQRKILQLFLDFLTEPEVLLLDEPLNGLDHQARRSVVSRILSLSRENKIVLVSTHVFSDIENLTNKVFILKDGNISFHESENGISEVYDKLFPLEKEVLEGLEPSHDNK